MPLSIINNSVAAKQYEGLQAAGEKHTTAHHFKSELAATIAPNKQTTSPPRLKPDERSSPPAVASLKLANPPRPNMVNAYQKSSLASSHLSGWEQYKEDQLLSNPGGDGYEIRNRRILPASEVPTSFWGRVGKDFTDGMANLTNGIINIFSGANRSYRDVDGQIKTVNKGGVFRSIGRFIKNIGSALTFGQWHPGEENGPEGFMERAKFTFSKLKNAVMGDLVQGVAGSTLQVGEDLLLAGLNLVEIVPDATIGNVDGGKKLTTAIFDNGQVAVDYLTDILPTGEAWLRVHALSIKERKPPIFYNLSLKAHYKGDARWQTVRNTSFRKTIETIGALLADVATLKLISNVQGNSQGRKKETVY